MRVCHRDRRKCNRSFSCWTETALYLATTLLVGAFRFGDMEVDFGSSQARRDGQMVNLASKELELIRNRRDLSGPSRVAGTGSLWIERASEIELGA